MADFVEICNICARKALIEAAKRIINSDKVCHSYSDLNFGVTFLEHSVYMYGTYGPGSRPSMTGTNATSGCNATLIASFSSLIFFY